jgi:hypothetical protein
MRWLPIVRFARASTFDIPDDANMDGYALNIRWLTFALDITIAKR